MKKLNKSQKQKLKNNIFKVLHVLGYISIGLLVVIFTIVGVQNCHPKTQDSEVSLKVPSYNANDERRSDEGTLYIPWANGYRTRSTYNYDSFYNINSDGSIINLQYSIYHVDKQSIMDVTDSECFFYDSNNDLTFSQVRVLRFDSSTGAYDNSYNRASFVKSLWFYNGSVYGRLDTGLPTSFFSVYDSYNYMVIIYNYCIIKNDNKVALYNMFEGVLINTGTLTSDFINNNLSSLNYNDSLSFINEYWYRGYDDSYLYPLILPNDELENNNSNSYCPLYFYNVSSPLGYCKSINTSYSVVKLDGVNFADFTYHNTFGGIRYGAMKFYGVDGFNEYSSTFGVGFKLYGGCYKFHNLFQNFIRYSFKLYVPFAEWKSQLVIFNVAFSIFPNDIFNYYKNTYGVASITLFDSASYGYDGALYSSLDFGDNKFFLSSRYNVIEYDNYYIGHVTFRSGYYYQFKQVFQHPGPNGLVLLDFSLDTPLIDDITQGGSTPFTSVFVLLGTAFNSLAGILNISIFGAITIGSLMFLPLVVIILLFVIRLFKR